MTTTQARALTIAGGLLIALALILGSQKITAGDVTCGSAFGASIGTGQAPVYGTSTVRDCRDSVSERRFIALGVGALGAAALLGGSYQQRRETPAA